MGFGEMAVLIHLFHQNRPSTCCAKLSSTSTIPHRQCTFKMGFGEMAVLIHLFYQNRPSTRCAKLSSISTIPHKQCKFETGFGKVLVLIGIFHSNRQLTGFQNCLLFCYPSFLMWVCQIVVHIQIYQNRPSTRYAKLPSILTIPHIVTFQMGFVGINTPYLMVQHIIGTDVLQVAYWARNKMSARVTC